MTRPEICLKLLRKNIIRYFLYPSVLQTSPLEKRGEPIDFIFTNNVLRQLVTLTLTFAFWPFILEYYLQSLTPKS